MSFALMLLLLWISGTFALAYVQEGQPGTMSVFTTALTVGVVFVGYALLRKRGL